MLFGFDISHYQGVENFSNMRIAYGASFVVAKATEGLTYVDPSFSRNWDGIKKAGMVRGAYHFARTSQNPVACADKFVSVVRPSDPTDLLILDLESSTVSNESTRVWAIDWCRRVKALCPGYAVGIYTPYVKNTTSIGWNKVFDYWWYARYPSAYNNKAARPGTFNPVLPDVNHFGPPLFWQYTQSFPVNGEPHDANVFNGGISELLRLNPGARSVNPEKSTEDDMATVYVIAQDRSAGGMWSAYLAVTPTGVYGINQVQWKVLASTGAVLVQVPNSDFAALYQMSSPDPVPAPVVSLTDAQIEAMASAIAAKVSVGPAVDFRAVITDVIRNGIG